MIEQKGGTDKSAVESRNFNDPISMTYTTIRKSATTENTHKATRSDIHTFLTAKAEYSIFPSIHRTYTKIDHIPVHKINLNKFKRLKS